MITNFIISCINWLDLLIDPIITRFSILDFLTQCKSYYNTMFSYFNVINYFLPSGHFRVIMGFLIGILSIRVLLALWHALPLT